jgi:hypothetical protein
MFGIFLLHLVHELSHHVSGDVLYRTQLLVSPVDGVVTGRLARIMDHMQDHEWALESLRKLTGEDQGGLGGDGKISRYEDGLLGSFFCWHSGFSLVDHGPTSRKLQTVRYVDARLEYPRDETCRSGQ